MPSCFWGWGLVKSVGEGRENTGHVGATTHEGRALGLRAGLAGEGS